MIRKLICRCVGHKWGELCPTHPYTRPAPDPDPDYFISSCRRCGEQSHWHSRGPVWFITIPFEAPRRPTPKEQLMLDEVLAHQ